MMESSIEGGHQKKRARPRSFQPAHGVGANTPGITVTIGTPTVETPDGSGFPDGERRDADPEGQRDLADHLESGRSHHAREIRGGMEGLDRSRQVPIRPRTVAGHERGRERHDSIGVEPVPPPDERVPRFGELEDHQASAGAQHPRELADRFAAAGERLRPHITDTVYLVHDEIRAGRSVLFEGANACLLDIDHGTFPYVTSSNCSTLGIPAGSGVPGRMIGKVYGIMKAYSTRVGGGPFVTELLDETGERIRKRGREYGTTTGRPRRCGWLDLVAVKYSAMVCGADAIACTLLDVLSGFDELKICVGYRRADGTITDRFIPDAERMHGFTPVYETFAGWERELTTCTDREDLPREAQAYLGFVEQFVGIPVELVSVGPERTQTFESNERFAVAR